MSKQLWVFIEELKVSLKCCNKNVQIIEEIDLFDTKDQTHRFLVIGRCQNPNCGALKAQIIYYDIKQNKFIYEKIKNKELAYTIKTLKQNPFLKVSDLEVNSINYSNINWIYGLTKITKEKNIRYLEDWAIDFNGTKKLVRKKELGNTQTNCITTCN